ncbi:uncharacterized protein BDCG_06687 [Blastomyces dermatitidis ER-3]|uniref:Uncharacterized protein n=1 Tax=Ajellomyces dermatitidis (strain ER-3 / ATCC MYA-2586) TaxID=559297 RepID=A0ABP2F4G3_AJEDR|nr:uncharacterized protein BDCG_06687 [Blastomyces dermatitidis ER-3]EEQ91567.1 hypothetical protein BDCG_06687 [Blastomyces dermatitidis ER-3]
MKSYITVLTEKGGSITTAVRRAGNELNMNKLTGRRDNTSLQGTVTTATAAKEAGEEGDMTIKAVLSQLIDTVTFNLTFLIVTEAAAAPQRHLFTRKHQNKPSIIL